MTVPTRDELTADRVTLVNARTSLLTSQTVKEVWRDGRKLVFNAVTVESLNAAIVEIDRQIEAIDRAAGTAGPARYRALSVRFGA